MKITILLPFFVTAIACNTVNAQSADSQKKKQSAKQEASTAANRYEQAREIQKSYKTAAAKTAGDMQLSDADRRKEIERLIREKNKQLSALLTPEELDDIVPASERPKSRKQISHNKQPIVSRRDSLTGREFMSKSLTIPPDKAREVNLAQLTFKENCKQVICDSSLSETERRSKLNMLIKERNQRLNSLLTPAQVNKIVPVDEQKL